MSGLRFALCLLLLFSAACSLQAGAPATQSLPPDEAPSAATSTPDPLLATMEQVTIPPLTVYESPRFAYRFSYPVTSAIEVTGDGELVWIDAQIFISVMTVNPEQAQGDGPVIETAEDTMVNGIPSRRLTGYIGSIGGNTPQNYQTLVIAAGERFYVITVYELRRDVVLPVERTRGAIPLPVLSVFDILIATFGLTG
jgi:ribosomal protein L21E